MTNFDRQLFIWLFFSFIVATIIGTLTHECGHYYIAEFLGYDAHITYNYTSWVKSNPNQVINPTDNFWMLLGGPLETMLTGTIGIALLFSIQKSIDKVSGLSLQQWLFVFVSLFWLRQPANFFAWVGSYFLYGKFSERADEIKLSRYLQIPDWTIITMTATIGIIVLAVIIFKFIPIKQRVTFIISGLAGGTVGYILWFQLLGPMILGK